MENEKLAQEYEKTHTDFLGQQVTFQAHMAGQRCGAKSERERILKMMEQRCQSDRRAHPDDRVRLGDIDTAQELLNYLKQKLAEEL